MKKYIVTLFPLRSCSRPSARTMVVCVLLLVIVISLTMVMYLLPGCTFTKVGKSPNHLVRKKW